MALNIHFSPKDRAREKEDSRVMDARSLSSGKRSHRELISENEPLRAIASSARVNLRASKSLF